jgi:hypothetical protein
MLEILRDELGEPETLGVGPQVGVGPRQLIGGSASQRDPDQLLVREEDVEPTQELLRLATRIGGVEQRLDSIERSSHGRDAGRTRR